MDTTPNQNVGTQLILWQCLVPDHIHQAFERTAEMEFRVASRPELCMDGGNGTRLSPVTLQPCHGGAGQKWNMLGYGELQLQAGNNLCLTVPDDRNDNGTRLVVDTCNTSIHLGQQWSYRNPR